MTPRQLPEGYVFRDDRPGKVWWDGSNARTVYAGPSYTREIGQRGDCGHPSDVRGPDGRRWCFGCSGIRPDEQILGPMWTA